MVEMNGCAAIDSVRPFRFCADKRRLPPISIREMALAIMEKTNSKQIKCGPT